MPRLENSGAAVNEWADRSQVPSHMVDLCDTCACVAHKENYPSWVRLDNDEPKGTLESADWHPDYSEVDYRCDFCSAELGEDDNDPDACDTSACWIDK
tara:strand:- start:7119 stop:7412 length:294 start_codon:yes stop_codon:yes gene_type:complete